jgi:uncharacterized protein (DUF1501 family)
MSNISRRNFMKGFGCTGMSMLATAGMITDLRAIGTLAAANAQSLNDYKALVCVFLQGGNDGANTVIPTSSEEFRLYQEGRKALALPRNSLLNISPTNVSGRTFALNPNITTLAELFNRGHASILSNVGSLVAPVTDKNQVNTGGPLIPKNLFSHSDQTTQWLTSIADRPSRTGWAGRIADIISSVQADSPVSMNFSLHPNGANALQVGNLVTFYTVPDAGVPKILGYRDAPEGRSNSTVDIKNYQTLNDILSQPRSNLLMKEYSTLFLDAMDKSSLVGSAMDRSPALGTIFPDTFLGKQLRTAIRLISARNALKHKRQIFYVEARGYDTHGLQIGGNHANLLRELNDALKAFYDALIELNLLNSVLTFTASEFGRTFTANSNEGSDHGWGSHHFIIGGGVSGQKIFGEYPMQVLNGPLDPGRGNWIPSTSVDEYAATLARWFGITDSQLDDVFPNLRNFKTRNLGFFT